MVHAVKPVMRRELLLRKLGKLAGNVIALSTQVTTDVVLKLSEKLQLHATFAVKVRGTMTHGTQTTSSPLTLPHLLHLPTNPATNQEGTNRSNLKSQLTRLRFSQGRKKMSKKRANRCSNVENDYH